MRRENLIQGRQTGVFFMPAVAFEDFRVLAYDDFYPYERGWDSQLFDLCVFNPGDNKKSAMFMSKALA